jgi:YgiT-type zinc finger domain-containing protein
MKCVVCKQGETRHGTATLVLQRGGATVVVNEVPGRVCENCGEEYVEVSEQGKLDITQVPAAAKGGARKPVLPKALPERITTIRGLLADQPRPAHVEELARGFQRVPRDDVQEVLNALVALGLARQLDDNRYAP